MSIFEEMVIEFILNCLAECNWFRLIPTSTSLLQQFRKGIFLFMTLAAILAVIASIVVSINCKQQF